MKEIDTKALCQAVISRCETLRKEFRDHLDVEHILMALGGLANIYMEALNNKKSLKTSTYNAFASVYAPVEEILLEIQHCIGVDHESSKIIFEAMQTVFKQKMCEHVPSQWISFPPLGKFKILNLRESSYHFIYEDPAFKISDKFLIKYRSVQ